MNLENGDKELIQRGTAALIKELGYSGFIKYISRIQMYSGDYFRPREVIYTGLAEDESAIES
jgi:hypothetical protein